MANTRLERIFDEIVRHVRWTGDTILSADNPPAFIGWCTETGMKSWSISINHARQDLNAMQDQAKANILRNAMTTATGRMNLARSFPGQRAYFLISSPVFECPRCGSQTWVPDYSADMHSKEECDERLISNIQES